jgi:hypothetical protein
MDRGEERFSSPRQNEVVEHPRAAPSNEGETERDQPILNLVPSRRFNAGVLAQASDIFAPS